MKAVHPGGSIKAVPNTKGFKVRNKNFSNNANQEQDICFVVYTGKNTVLQSRLITPDTHKTATVILGLLQPLFGRELILWIDFNSPELARKLKIEHSIVLAH